MKPKKTGTIRVTLGEAGFQAALRFVEQWMSDRRIDQQNAAETVQLLEALFHQLAEQGYDPDTVLTVRPQRSFGESIVKIGFEGRAYVPAADGRGDSSVGSKIMQAYNDKIRCGYRLGYNSIRIVIRRNYRQSFLFCMLGGLLAVLVYIPIGATMSPEQQVELDRSVLDPLLKIFANLMLTVGTPITLFSLIKNLTDIYIVSEKSSAGRRLQMKTIATSIISILLALGTSLAIITLVSYRAGYLETKTAFSGVMSFSDFFATFVPSSIFEPFDTIMPFPIIIVALLITYAMCSIGGYFGAMQKIVSVGYALFSRMLNVVMFTLPFFFFLAILTALLPSGFTHLLVIVQFVILVILSLVVMAAFYLIRLLVGGVNIGAFLKHLPSLIWENIKINSAISAVPFNIRHCAQNYGYSRKSLSAKLPILAETNLDGNCYLIMLITMLFIFLLGVETSWLHILEIAILILFLSLGAPNQPGSIAIGILIITFFLKADSLIAVAIYAEVFFGAIQNIINVIGDIVTVAIEESKARE